MLVVFCLLILLPANFAQHQISCTQHFARIIKVCGQLAHTDDIRIPIPEEANSAVLSFDGGPGVLSRMAIYFGALTIKLYYRFSGKKNIMFSKGWNIEPELEIGIDIHPKFWVSWNGAVIEAGLGDVIGQNKDISVESSTPPHMRLYVYPANTNNIDLTVKTSPCVYNFGLGAIAFNDQSSGPTIGRVNLPCNFDSDNQCLILSMDMCGSESSKAEVVLKKYDIPLSKVYIHEHPDGSMNVRSENYCESKIHKTDYFTENCNLGYKVYISSKSVKVIGNEGKINQAIKGFGSFDSFMVSIKGTGTVLHSSTGDCV